MSDGVKTSSEEVENASTVRRRKVLANSQKRMERLQRLKRSEVDVAVSELTTNSCDVGDGKLPSSTSSKTETHTAEENTATQQKVNENLPVGEMLVTTTTTTETSEIIAATTKTPESTYDNSIGLDKTRTSKVTTSIEDYIVLSKEKEGNKEQTNEITQQDLHSLGADSFKNNVEIKEEWMDKINVNDEAKENQVVLSLFFRKRRLIIFVLLALVSYCIAHKGFDIYLSSFFAYVGIPSMAWDLKNSGSGVDSSFAKLYAAVELQMVLGALMSGSDDLTTKVPPMLRLAAGMLGLPSFVLRWMGKLSALVQMVVTDFSVYLFTYVMLLHCPGIERTHQ